MPLEDVNITCEHLSLAPWLARQQKHEKPYEINIKRKGSRYNLKTTKVGSSYHLKTTYNSSFKPMFSNQDTRNIPLNKTIYAITSNASKHISCTPQMQQTRIHGLAPPTCVLLQILIPFFSSILLFISNPPS
jgi:hypothetical protein